MRVLIVNCFDINGGAARAAYRLHKALLESGVDSQMLVQHKSSNDFLVHNPKSKTQRLKALIRPFLESTLIKNYKKRESVLFSPGLIPWSGVSKLINKINPDIVHLHWVTNGMIHINDIYKIKAPVVWSLHDMWAFTGGCHYNQDCLGFQMNCGKCPVLNSKIKKDLSRRVWKRKQNSYQRKSNMTIIGLSKWMVESAASSTLLKQKKIINLPNPINTKIFAPFDKSQARKILNLPIDKKLILFGATTVNNERRKGYVELLLALNQLSSSYELVIFGVNRVEDKHETKQKSHFIGALGDDVSLRLLYCSADVMVVPSLQENLSNTIMESMACGTPVVGFNIGGNSDLIEHSKTGYLAKPFDIKDLAAGIEWAIKEGDGKQISRNNREKILLQYDSKHVANQYINLYKQLVREFKKT